MSNFPAYHLGNSQPRRAGLTRSGYKGPSLLTVNAVKSRSQNTMPPTPSTKPTSSGLKKSPVKEDVLENNPEEDINRMPDDDSSSEEESKDAAGIETWDQREARKKSQYEKQSGKKTVNSKSKSGFGNERSRRLNASPSLNASTGSQKRKSEEELPKLGANMVDAHGRLNFIGIKRAKYGTSSQPSNCYGKNSSCPKREAQSSPVTPKKDFKAPDLGSSSDEADSPDLPNKFRKPSLGFDSPVKGTEAGNLFKKPDILESSPLSTPGPSTRFKAPEISSSPASDYMKDLPEDLLEKARSIISSNQASIQCQSNTAPYDDTLVDVIKASRCPLCHELVDAVDLQAYGYMNTREQGKFCIMHRKKTAKADWSSKGYPEINWNKLDSRISKHYSFIKKLINGSDSHYRDLLEEKVNAGMDRNLRQMTSNLTPGYYGSRGLRVISENIMRKFTPLLKKRMVQDDLMSARGVNPYVQLVLVPEVVVLLIQEDMGVNIDEARQLLIESAAVGELLNEELRDVVTKRVADSEDENDDGYTSSTE